VVDDRTRRDLLRASKHLRELQRAALKVYRPINSEQARFQSSRARRLVARGGNRAGKTTCGAEKMARIVTGQHPAWPQPGKALVVSLDLSLLSKNCYTKLFEPGAFRVCDRCHQSKVTCTCEGLFEDHSKPAPPLIPQSAIKQVVWSDRGRKIPDRVYMKSGWQIDFRSCESGRMKFQGDAWHVVWIDEEGGSDEEVMSEIERGLLETSGWLWWTATPLACGIKLLEYSERAQEERNEREIARAGGEEVPEDPYHEEVILVTDENIALPQEAIKRFFEGMGEEEEAVRRGGTFLVQQGLVYREWDKNIHIVEPYAIPEDWTVYDLLDPGHANVFAILFLAVKPDGDWVIFDELYLHRVDIPDVVKLWHKKLRGDAIALNGRPHWSQRTGIDPSSEQTGPGMGGKSTRAQIHRERRRWQFRSFEGEYKTYKCPNAQQAGIFAVKGLLRLRSELPSRHPLYNTPKLTVMANCHHFVREIRRLRYKRPTKDKSVDEKRGTVERDDHLMDLIRYAALMRLSFVPPHQRPPWAHGEAVMNKFAKLKRRKARRAARDRKKAFDCT
jgi:phage terminase large subunit-like protein